MIAKKLYRSKTDVMVAGICGGLAEYFDIDSSLIRIIFVVLLLNFGTGFLAYLILWFIVPSAKQNNVSAKQNNSSVGQNIDEVTEEIKNKAKTIAKKVKKEVKNKKA